MICWAKSAVKIRLVKETERLNDLSGQVSSED